MSDVPSDLGYTETSSVSGLRGTVLDVGYEGLIRAYSDALLNVLAEEGNPESAFDELDELVSATTASTAYDALAVSPEISRAEKDRILLRLFQGKLHPTLMTFIRVLNRAGRLDLLSGIARHVRRAWNLRQNKKTVHVCSAVPLGDAEKRELHKRLLETLGSEPILDLTVDPAILGGMTVQVGDIVYDSSLRSQLDRLRKQLVEEKILQLRGQLATRALAD